MARAKRCPHESAPRFRPASVWSWLLSFLLIFARVRIQQDLLQAVPPRRGGPHCPQDIRSLRQEIEILRGLKHEHIIEMSDAFETKSEFCVVTEFAQGELFEVRRPLKPPPPPLSPVSRRYCVSRSSGQERRWQA